MKEIKDFRLMTLYDLIAYCKAAGLEVSEEASKIELIKLYLKNEYSGFTKAELNEAADRLGYEQPPASWKKEQIIDSLAESVITDYLDEVANEIGEDMPEEEPTETLAPDGLPLEDDIDFTAVEAAEIVPEPEENSDPLPEQEPAAQDMPEIPKDASPEELRKISAQILKTGRETEKKQSKSAAERAARDERRRMQARMIDATTRLSENEDIEMRAYGDDADYRPRQLRNAPKSLSIDGSRLRITHPGEEDDLDLVESYNNPSYIPFGIVTDLTKKREFYAVNPKTGEKQKFVNVSAIVRYGERDVLIPAVYFFEDYYDMNQNDILKLMQGRLKSEVDFRVVKIDRQSDPKNPIYTGSRIAAMRKKRCDYWYSERTKGQQLLEKDSIVEARIVAVTQHLIFVEVFGAEFPIYTSDIAHTYIRDVRYDTDYAPGDTEIVMLKSVTLQDKNRAAALGWPVKCEGSIKDTIEDNTESYLMKLREGSFTIGTVTNVRIGKNNTNDIYVNNGRIDIFCRVSQDISMRPKIGDSVQIKIKRVDVPNRFVFGYIQHITPAKINGRRR